jgi:hypothetical protein
MDYNNNNDIKISEQYVRGLDADAKNALELYTGKFYVAMNNNIRKGIALKIKQQKIFDTINRVFDESPVIGEPMILYRGVDLDKPGELKIYNKGFISTSLNKQMALIFSNIKKGCCLVKILVSPGSKILSLVSLSEVPDEAELLLSAAKGEFKVTSVGMDVNNMTLINVTYIPKGSVKLDKVSAVDKKLVKFTFDELKNRILAQYDDFDYEFFEDIHDLRGDIRMVCKNLDINVDNSLLNSVVNSLVPKE